MAGSLNKVTLIGHLGRDPEIRSSQSGDRIGNLSLATSESWKDKSSGERREKTEWHRVVIFNERLVELAERFLKKGSKVYLEGALQTRKWTDQAGTEKYTTEIVLQRFRGEILLLDRAERDPGAQSENDYGRQDDYVREGGIGPDATGRSGGGRPDLDDDIPF